jgi:hypothetical protein
MNRSDPESSTTTSRSPILIFGQESSHHKHQNLEMAPSPLQQRRTHNTLLFQKLLNLRENGTSPFTLVLDNLEQGGGPVIREFARRGKVRASSFVSSRSIACDSGRVYCGVWPIKCRQGSKTDKSNCQVLKKSTYDWLVGNPSQDLLARDHIMQVYYSGVAFSFAFETWVRHPEDIEEISPVT